MFHAGFYETEITPPIGSIIPGDFGARYSTRILDPLFARTVVIQLDAATVGIVTIDCCGITSDITDRIRKRVAAYVPLSPDAVMVTATHCHGGGPTLNWGEEVVRSEEYLDFLVQRAADALICAFHRLRACTLRSGSSELYGCSFIRVYRMRDGSLKTNPGVGNPDIDAPVSEIDPEVRILAAFGTDGSPFGAIVNFACHPAIVASDVTSADYIGALSEKLREIYGQGFVTVFLNGACGNINHINPDDPSSVRDGIHIALGHALAGRAAEAIDAAQPIPETLTFALSETTLRRRKPDADALLHAKAVYDALGEHAEESVPGTPGYIDTFFAWQAFGLIKDRRQTMTLPVQVITVGSIAVFGVPCQIFVEYGRALKAASPGAMVSAFANTYGGYVPTPSCMVPGVYEARLASTSQLAPEAGDQLVEALLSL
ncbi:MAG: hypothetical protein VB111_07715 [Clostridiaceae bacterium]|nr:hypothetical protein [Clostridiaceae bacterium]